VRANGDKIKTSGKVGDSLLDVVVNNSVDLDGFGACEGTLTCSTCHLIFKTSDFEKLPDKPGDDFLQWGYKELTTVCTHQSRVNLSPLLMKSSIITQTAAMMEAKPITKPTSSQILAILAPDSEGFSSEICTQNNRSESFGEP